jgi:hypothetical protein
MSTAPKNLLKNLLNYRITWAGSGSAQKAGSGSASSEKSDPDPDLHPHQIKIRIRIRIKAMRIRNTGIIFSPNKHRIRLLTPFLCGKDWKELSHGLCRWSEMPTSVSNGI